MRRALRLLGTLMILAGLAGLGWAFVVWRWQDPFTAVYTHIEQRELASDYRRRFDEFGRRPLTPATVADPAAKLRADARRYRKGLGRGQAVGRLRVPRLGLNMMIVNGTDRDTLKKGPGRYLGSFMPGEGQLVYVAGHRTTYSAPFSRIESLRRGDPVTVELPYARFEYRITSHVVVPATALRVLRSQGREVLALQACHPRFFASERYIAYARPIRVVPRGPDARPIPAAALAASGSGSEP
jgi:sortase A